ncbi:MAG TPA: hypothetical protein VHB30_11935 [Solirubrobacteraceae bacterium]|nr:hypothetical protein [Solirubrobacteraceae bacterium]
MSPLAHIGHWTNSLLYVAPVAVVLLALWWRGRRDGHPEREQPGAPAERLDEDEPSLDDVMAGR